MLSSVSVSVSSSTTSVTSITSVTTMLAIGVTAASVLLSFVLVGLLIGKEISVAHSGIDDRVKQSFNAALVPLALAFAAVIVLQLA